MLKQNQNGIHTSRRGRSGVGCGCLSVTAQCSYANCGRATRYLPSTRVTTTFSYGTQLVGQSLLSIVPELSCYCAHLIVQRRVDSTDLFICDLHPVAFGPVLVIDVPMALHLAALVVRRDTLAPTPRRSGKMVRHIRLGQCRPPSSTSC